MPDKQQATENRPPMKCPICGKPSAAPASEKGKRSPFPFCSDRCKLRDLGRWLDGEYQVPTEDDDLDESIVTTEQG